MAKVFSKNKTINHFLWEFLAAFHKATPFQGKTQRKIKRSQRPLIEVSKLAFKLKRELNIFLAPNAPIFLWQKMKFIFQILQPPNQIGFANLLENNSSRDYLDGVYR